MITKKQISDGLKNNPVGYSFWLFIITIGLFFGLAVAIAVGIVLLPIIAVVYALYLIVYYSDLNWGPGPDNNSYVTFRRLRKK